MYQLMTLVRTFDTKAVNLQRTGKLGTYASCLGHEATHVGAGAAMKAEDVLVPVYREYGAQFWRGVKMSDVLLYWGGDERGNNFENATRDFAWCVPIGTQSLHAAGAAMAFKVRGEKRCALAFIGDGGTSQGAFYEALNLAGARSLPVVFVIVNNKWAISVPISSQTAAATLAQKAVAAGIPGVQVDGNDAIAVRHMVGQALAIARNGGGPIAHRGDYLSPERSHDGRRCEPLSARGRGQERLEGRAADPVEKVPDRHGRLERREGNRTQDGMLPSASKRPSRNMRTPVSNRRIAMFDFLFAKLPEAAAGTARTGAKL